MKIKNPKKTENLGIFLDTVNRKPVKYIKCGLCAGLKCVYAAKVGALAGRRGLRGGEVKSILDVTA